MKKLKKTLIKVYDFQSNIMEQIRTLPKFIMILRQFAIFTNIYQVEFPILVSEPSMACIFNSKLNTSTKNLLEISAFYVSSINSRLII